MTDKGINNHPPQCSCGKVISSQASIILSTGVGVCQTPPGRPPGQIPPLADTPQADSYCSGRYESCWNAFLLFSIFSHKYIPEQQLCILMSLLHPPRVIVHVIWHSGESGIQEQISYLRFLKRHVMLTVRLKHVAERNKRQYKTFIEILTVKLI